MKKQVLATSKAPAAIGPYSQGVAFQNLLFVSGQLPIDPLAGTISGGIGEQTEQVFANLEAILAAGGASFDDVVKTTVFLTDLSDFAVVNEIYDRHFKEPYPARACVEVSKLPKGALIEIELIAVKS